MYCPSKARCFYCHCLFSECFKYTIQLQGVCSSSCAYPLQCSYDRPEHLPNSGPMSLGKRLALSLQLCGGWRRCVGFGPECYPPVSFFHCATQQAVVAVSMQAWPCLSIWPVLHCRTAFSKLRNGRFYGLKRAISQLAGSQAVCINSHCATKTWLKLTVVINQRHHIIRPAMQAQPMMVLSNNRIAGGNDV